MDEYANLEPADWSSETTDASMDASTEASSLTIHEESSVSYEYDADDENGAACATACGFDDDDMQPDADPVLDAAFAAAFDDSSSASADITFCHGLPGGYTITYGDTCRHDRSQTECKICKCDKLVGMQTNDTIPASSYQYTCPRGHNIWLGPTGRDCIACMHEDVYAASSIAVRCECPREGDPVRVECGRCGIISYMPAWTDEECALLCTRTVTYDCTHAHRLSNDVLDTRAWVRSICEFLFEARFDDMCPIQNTAYSASLRVIVTCTDDEASQSQRPIHYARSNAYQHVHVQYAPSRTELICNIVQAFNKLGDAFARPTQYDAVIADYNMRAGICAHVDTFELGDNIQAHTTSRSRTPPKTLRRCKEFNIHGEIAHLRKDISMSLPKFTKRDVANALPQSTLTKPRKVSSAALIKL
jgi:hypothetical protein